ncbi:MAG: alanine--tRNA ligase [Bacteroidetes bacterium HGW-Bacteroidetes-22]|nr:MAG: alanine--tRNA ligase [Bacteroidetes bacterium HGW-Bacteroidetes-22]
MKSAQIRQTFLDFFNSKEHQIVPSAPMVIKNDPTLMFTNAGMNQFKDIFLGNVPAKFHRVADTQKCLRVSGKHNDLEEVGHDTYHHTMFEMLGNWSFGDYFKKEAIEWAWELLTDVYKLDKAKLYVTVFGGDEAEAMEPDNEARDYWGTHIAVDRILYGSKKDNFWEMGDTGPCGPCSEIHIDLRTDAEIAALPGRDLVNAGHPQVVEIWNLVFIQFNRMADGSLRPLPARHVDTGMGFERLCMALQKKRSNYDTDVFQPLLQEIAGIAGLTYGQEEAADVAMRVIADHCRTLAFAIADGQLPSNVKAGYVIRRILRRAVRYGFTFLNLRDPFINKLIPTLVDQMGPFFPELVSQKELITRVITEEETNFLRTLAHGIHRFGQYMAESNNNELIDGQFAFELFDTFGFPVDLTQLMAREQGKEVDMAGFMEYLNAQKVRSRQAALKDTDDWVMVADSEHETIFVGYDTLVAETELVKYRRVKTPKRTYFQLVLSETPFYAESGGQTGDTGWLTCGEETFEVENTVKENNLIVHITSKLPADLTGSFKVLVDETKRTATTNNHSATHLLHAALRQVLGTHVEQKGSLVDPERFRFDFAHFAKLTDEEIVKVEDIVNGKIRANIQRTEHRNLEIEKARQMGAMALFGEKYGDQVRVISFDPQYSIELCGGTHVPFTGQIGLFKIVSESAVAAGVRRIEGITARVALDYFNRNLGLIEQIKVLVKNPADVIRGVNNLLEENQKLNKELEELRRQKVLAIKSELKKAVRIVNGINFLACKVDADAATVRDLVFALKQDTEKLFVLLAYVADGKPGLTLMIADELVKEGNLNAGQIIRNLAKEIRGGGGGQPNFATAGGADAGGIDKALALAGEIIKA